MRAAALAGYTYPDLPSTFFLRFAYVVAMVRRVTANVCRWRNATLQWRIDGGR